MDNIQVTILIYYLYILSFFVLFSIKYDQYWKLVELPCDHVMDLISNGGRLVPKINYYNLSYIYIFFLIIKNIVIFLRPYIYTYDLSFLSYPPQKRTVYTDPPKKTKLSMQIGCGGYNIFILLYSTSLKGVDFEERRCRFLHLWTQHYLVIFPSCENSIHFENLRNLMAIINSDNPTTQIFSSRIFKQQVITMVINHIYTQR